MDAKQKLKDLRPNPQNPRTITAARLSQLEKALKRFGDLSGFVYNVRTKRLVGGHQRAKVFAEARIFRVKTFEKPTKKGTVAIGFVSLDGERFAYREVSWDEVTEKAASIAANRNGGDWDQGLLAAWMKEIEASSLDMDLTMFSELEIADLLASSKSVPTFPPGAESDQGKLDQKKKVECPECGHRFTPGWT